MKTNIKVIATSLTLAASVSTMAGMSGLNVQSHLGQPFSGSIVVSGDEARALIAEGRVSVSGGIRATLIPQGEDRVLVRLRSSSPVREPILTFTVSAGRQTREYTAILDPIRYTPKAVPAVERTISSSHNDNQDVQRDMTHTQKVRHMSRNPDAQLQALKKSSKVAVSPRRHRAHVGDNLADIAERYRPHNMSLQTAMRALMLANPSAFKHGSTVRRHVTLYIPTESQWYAYAKRAQKRIQSVRAPQRTKPSVSYQTPNQRIDMNAVEDDNVAVTPKAPAVQAEPKKEAVKPVTPTQTSPEVQPTQPAKPIKKSEATSEQKNQPVVSSETTSVQEMQPSQPATPPKVVETPVQPSAPATNPVKPTEASPVVPKPASQENAVTPSNASSANTDNGTASVATPPEQANQAASTEANAASTTGASATPPPRPPVTEQPQAVDSAPVVEEATAEEETDWLMLAGGAVAGLALIGGGAALLMRRRRQNSEEGWGTVEDDENDYIPAHDVDDEWGDTDIILSNNHQPKPVSSTNFDEFDEFDDSSYTAQSVSSSVSASSDEFSLDNFDDNQDFVAKTSTASVADEVIVDGDWDLPNDNQTSMSSFASSGVSSSASSVVLDDNDTFDLNDFGRQDTSEQEWSLDATQDIKPVFATEEQSFSLDDFVVEETPVVASAPSAPVVPVAEDLTFDLSEFDTPSTPNVPSVTAEKEVVSFDGLDVFNVGESAPVEHEAVASDDFAMALDSLGSFEETFEAETPSANHDNMMNLDDFMVDVAPVAALSTESLNALPNLDSLSDLDNLDSFDLPVVDDMVINEVPVVEETVADMSEDLAFGLEAFDDNFAVPSVDVGVANVDIPVVEDDLSFGLEAFDEVSVPVADETPVAPSNSNDFNLDNLDELLATDSVAALDALDTFNTNPVVVDDFAEKVVPDVSSDFSSLDSLESVESVDLSAFDASQNFSLDALDNLDMADDVLLSTPDVVEPSISLDAPEVLGNTDFGDLGNLNLTDEVFAEPMNVPNVADSFDDLLIDESMATVGMGVAEVGMMDLTTGPLADDVFASNLDEFEVVDEQQVLDWQEEGTIKTNTTNAGFVSGAVSDMTEPLEAKFELAKMYLEIDDANAARETLRELIAESTGQIQAEAQQLLAELGN